MINKILLTAIRCSAVCAFTLLCGCTPVLGRSSAPPSAPPTPPSAPAASPSAPATTATATPSDSTPAATASEKAPVILDSKKEPIPVPVAQTTPGSADHLPTTNPGLRPAELPDPVRPDAAQLQGRRWFAWLPSFSRPKLEIPRVHKIVIQQGNVITQAMVNRLKPGMTRAQVEFVMGKPVLDNLFQSNRWVYVFSEQKPDLPEHRLAMTLYFDKDALQRLSGDLIPGGKTGLGADEPIPVPSAFIPHDDKEKGPPRGRPPQRRR